MNRIEFMAQLERLLFDIPESDRNDAIAYYNGYFDEAGPENEDKIIQELGSPGKVAAVIKADMIASGNKGEYTERGYQNEQSGNQSEVPVQRYEETRTRRGAGRWAILIILIIFASPILLGIGGGLLGGAVGILGALGGIAIAIVTGGVGFLIGGVAAIVTGIIECFTNPAVGLVMMGSGMLLTALALLFLSLAIILLGRFLPGVFRACVNFISRIFHRGKRGEEE